MSVSPKVDIVIGASYGDEGKGREVNTLATENSLVIRFNGTSQSGHTVVNKGKRHVFNHFGSGTFQGADTYFSHHFWINPLTFFEEYTKLAKDYADTKFKVCKFYAAPSCNVITPYDMMLNQATEFDRAITEGERHGSCGMGLFEAIQRTEKVCRLPLQVAQLSPNVFRMLVERIRDYSIAEFERRGFKNDKLLSHMKDPQILTNYLETVAFTAKMIQSFYDNAECDRDLPHSMRDYTHYVFEGGQGLRLDQNNRTEFPNLTPSNTGSTNIQDVFDWLHLEKCQVFSHYISRTYLTKHGAGKFREDPVPVDWKIVDNTNVLNEYQQHLRIGYLNVDDMRLHINRDRLLMTDAIPRLVLNCADQTPTVWFWENGTGWKMPVKIFAKHLSNELSMEVTVNEPAGYC